MQTLLDEESKSLCDKVTTWRLARPLFMHVSDDETWLSCVDVCRELECQDSVAHLKTKAKKHHFVESKHVNRVRMPADGAVMTTNIEPHLELMLPMKKLSEFANAIIDRMRKSARIKQTLLRKFNLETEVSAPIECTLLDYFIMACPFPVSTQYHIGKYKLDAFVPRLNLGIQIDEDGHKSYDAQEEKEYDVALRDHNVVCIRFSPENDAYSEALRLINVVWQRTLSPDFSAFRIAIGK